MSGSRYFNADQRLLDRADRTHSQRGTRCANPPTSLSLVPLKVEEQELDSMAVSGSVSEPGLSSFKKCRCFLFSVLLHIHAKTHRLTQTHTRKHASTPARTPARPHAPKGKYGLWCRHTLAHSAVAILHAALLSHMVPTDKLAHQRDTDACHCMCACMHLTSGVAPGDVAGSKDGGTLAMIRLKCPSTSVSISWSSGRSSREHAALSYSSPHGTSINTTSAWSDTCGTTSRASPEGQGRRNHG